MVGLIFVVTVIKFVVESKIALEFVISAFDDDNSCSCCNNYQNADYHHNHYCGSVTRRSRRLDGELSLSPSVESDPLIFIVKQCVVIFEEDVAKHNCFSN